MTNFRAALVFWSASLFQKAKDLPGRSIVLAVELIVVLAAIASCLGDGYYNGKWEALSVAMAFALAVVLYEKFGLACAGMISYLLCSGIWILDYSNRYSTIQPYDLLGLKFFTAQSMYKLLIVTVPFAAIRIDQENLLRVGRALCAIFVVISLFQVGWEWLWYGCAQTNSCGGALRNPSTNASMLVVCLPLVAAVIPLGEFLLLPILGAALLGKSSIGIGMCVLWVVAYGWRTLNPGIVFLGAPVIFLLGKITHGHKELFNSSGRFQMWEFFIKLWAKNPKNWLFGTGFGTFGVFSTNLQQAFNVNPTDWWIWMHNDWLQMLFECGVVGLALMAWLYLSCVWKLRKQTPELQSLLLFGVMMGCNYPLHLAPCCLYAAWIAAVSLVKAERSAPVLR